MENKQILLDAIQKAIDNGWANGEVALGFVRTNWDGKVSRVRTILFDPEFAKALWGGKTPQTLTNKAGQTFEYEYWQYQLMQMVIADDPIKYLGGHNEHKV